MDESELLRFLLEDDPAVIRDLYARADAVRREHVGDAVHLRGLVEISSYCRRRCTYCGIRADRRDIPRYRLSADEILAASARAVELGYGTLVLQAGEDPGLTRAGIAALVRRIKAETPLAVTLSLGERDEHELADWRTAGADRYLLRFETSNRELFDRIHPPVPGLACDRLAMLRTLHRMGYEVGSGVMIGIPGQTYADLARDVALFAELELDMIGVGPFLPHPETPLGSAPAPEPDEPGPDAQVPATAELTSRVVALARLARPCANIPSTTALASLDPGGRELGLSRGANVVMPNLTPMRHRALYEIYPAKACLSEGEADFARALRQRIESMGRQVGVGRGDARRA